MKNIIVPYAFSLTSGFTSPSLLKARIKMIYQKPSTQWALTKFGFALPILVVCVVINACMEHKKLPDMSPKKDTNPKVILMKGQNGETYEALHYEGEKNEYELAADKVGLNDFIEHKDEHTLAETIKFYQNIENMALKETENSEIVKRMKGSLFSMLFYKGMHKSNRLEDIALLAEASLKNDKIYHIRLHPSVVEWFTERLPKLRNHWSADEFKYFKSRLLASYEPQIMHDIQMHGNKMTSEQEVYINQLKQVLAAIKSM